MSMPRLTKTAAVNVDIYITNFGHDQPLVLLASGNMNINIHEVYVYIPIGGA